MMDYVAVECVCVLRFRNDKNTLVITQIPFSTNTTTLIDYFEKPMKRVKSKSKMDNTAANVEILIHLSLVYHQIKLDALFAFACETSSAIRLCY
jgi:topoisomerase-4 subunit A